MSYIVGNEKGEFLVEDNGEVWNLKKTIRYNPETFYPFDFQPFQQYDIPVPQEKEPEEQKQEEPRILSVLLSSKQKTGPYFCKYCRSEYKTSYGFRKHMFLIHCEVPA